MRSLLAILLLCLGVSSLGYFAMVDAAPRIEAKIASDAQALVAGRTRHDVNVRVSGRDITISGLAHTDTERETLVASMGSVVGARTVVDNLDTVAQQRPYTFDIRKNGPDIRAEGFVPDLHSEKRLAEILPQGAQMDIAIASGEPNADWVAAIEASMRAISALESGHVSIIARDILMSGDAATQDIATNAASIANESPLGYSFRTDIKVLLPETSLVLEFDAIDGVKTSGSAPLSLDIASMRAALGTQEISGNLSEAKATNIDRILTAMKGVAPFIGAFDTAVMTFDGDDTRIKASVLPDVEPEDVAAALSGVVDPAALDIQKGSRAFSEGMTRINPATGAKESFSGAYWLPEMEFGQSAESCENHVAKITDGGEITFAPQTSNLNLAARDTVNFLFSIAIPCLIEDGVSLQITGAGTGALGQARAEVLADALVLRGYPVDRIVAKAAEDGDDLDDRFVKIAWITAPKEGENSSTGTEE